MISVIIPTLNAENYILRTLDIVNANNSGCVLEIIVVDGGSVDNTLNLIVGKDVILVKTELNNKAQQLNKAAEIAKGKILYFLQADTVPPLGFDNLIMRAFNQGYIAGAFQIRFDIRNKILGLYSYFSKYNWKIYQGSNRSLFVAKEAFDIIEGYPDCTIFEDFRLTRQLVKYLNFKVIPFKVISSARKFEKNGIVKLQLVFVFIHFLYLLGYKDETLAKVYNKLIC